MFAISFPRSQLLAPPPSPRVDSVSASDRERYAGEVAALEKALAEATSSAGGVDEAKVWDVYARVEMTIASLRLRLDYETPGAFTKLPDASDAPRLLEDAREALCRAAVEISGNKLVDSVDTLRRARNELRSFLVSKRKGARPGRRAPSP